MSRLRPSLPWFRLAPVWPANVVTGVASSTDNAIARFDSTSGTFIQNSGVTISDTNVMAGASISLTDNTVTFTSAELITACSNETGTGALVFATSPTLVTPVLGAATATTLSLGAAAINSGDQLLQVVTGTAPSAATADTVVFYSTDDAAGHTVPSFFCEGTNVIATGQADSVSSVRVKMRINGTVVTLLAI